MRGRVAKYFFIVTAIAAIVAVGKGVHMSFGVANYEVYCDFQVTAEKANVETPRGSCRLRIGRFVSVFGRIFLVLLGCFWVPVGLFLLVRRGIYGQVSPQEPLMGRRPPVRVQSVGVSSPSSGAGRIAEKIERWIGPFSAGYFTVSAFCVFQYVGFAAWVNLHHNSMGAYCRYDQIGRTGNFYAYGQICNINWVEWLQYWFVLTFVFTAILQIPIVTLGAYCCANRLYRHLQDRRG